MYIPVHPDDRRDPVKLVNQICGTVLKSLERMIQNVDFNEIDRIHFEFNLQKRRLP